MNAAIFISKGNSLCLPRKKKLSVQINQQKHPGKLLAANENESICIHTKMGFVLTENCRKSSLKQSSGAHKGKEMTETFKFSQNKRIIMVFIKTAEVGNPENISYKV